MSRRPLNNGKSPLLLIGAQNSGHVKGTWVIFCEVKSQDARCLSPVAQETLRHRVIRAVGEGMSQAEAARVFGVSRQAINGWSRRWRENGMPALQSKPRGRPSIIRLAPWQAATTVRLLTDRCPDQLKLPFALWTREAVRDLIVRRFGIRLSVWTVGRYLKRWGFMPQKPLRRAYERDPEAVRHWLTKEYPTIRALARRESATIYWGDEMGMRSDHQAGTSYGRRGKTPVIPGTGKRFRCNLISAITNRGKLACMVFGENFTTSVLILFLKRLIRHARRKAFLIVDEHPVHTARRVEQWVARHRRQVRLFFLPGYSPDLNPDELLNQDVKTNAVWGGGVLTTGWRWWGTYGVTCGVPSADLKKCGPTSGIRKSATPHEVSNIFRSP